MMIGSGEPHGPLVSVIMPVFNGMRHLDEALQSLLSQSYRHLEIIAIDDSSSDGSLHRLQQISATDQRVVPLAIAHGGIATARNAGLAAARGQLLTFLDQDDLCPPGRIARHVERLSRNLDAWTIFGRTLTTADVPLASEWPRPANAPQPLTMMLSAGTFRAGLFDSVGKFDPAYTLADDLDFLLRLMEAALAVEVEAELATVHRRHSAQATADLEATRHDCLRALAASLRRRRQKGNTGPLVHPLSQGRMP
jgi:glycosyltransferase involved in cell wall biosynthesis